MRGIAKVFRQWRSVGVFVLLGGLSPFSAMAEAHDGAVAWMERCLGYTERFVRDVDLSDPEFFEAAARMDHSCVWTPIEMCRFSDVRDACLEAVQAAQASHIADLKAGFSETTLGEAPQDCGAAGLAVRLGFAPIAYGQFCGIYTSASEFASALETYRQLEKDRP